MMMTVENSSDGNCMYYAYSISLMYFLRTKDQDTAEKIFNRLGLTVVEKVALHDLLSKDKDTAFSEAQIKRVIEPILGQATRYFAAEATRVGYKNAPEASSFLHAMVYGIGCGLKKHFPSIGAGALSKLIDDTVNDNLTRAEIYRVPGMERYISQYLEAKAPLVAISFQEQWQELDKRWSEREKEWAIEDGLAKTKEIARIKAKAEAEGKVIDLDKLKISTPIRSKLNSQQLILNTLIQELTVGFFYENNQQYLDAYIAHLQQDRVWGTEETLLIMHNALQGADGDTAINLEIFINDAPAIVKDASVRGDAAQPDMILNHVHGNHWNSIIPSEIFNSALSDSALSLNNSIWDVVIWDVVNRLFPTVSSLTATGSSPVVVPSLTAAGSSLAVVPSLTAAG
ncbi:MAG: hypothetical protein ACHP65_03060, partial [Legionellales bacterium]